MQGDSTATSLLAKWPASCLEGQTGCLKLKAKYSLKKVPMLAQKDSRCWPLPWLCYKSMGHPLTCS